MSDLIWEIDPKGVERLEQLGRDGYLMVWRTGPASQRFMLTQKGLSVLMAHAEPPIRNPAHEKTVAELGIVDLSIRSQAGRRLSFLARARQFFSGAR